MNLKKILGIAASVILVANIILFAIGLISAFLFWFVIIVMAFAAYYVIPKISDGQD